MTDVAYNGDRCTSCRGKGLTQHFLISIDHFDKLFQKGLILIYEHNWQF